MNARESQFCMSLFSLGVPNLLSHVFLRTKFNRIPLLLEPQKTQLSFGWRKIHDEE